MHFVLTGSSGFVGQALLQAARAAGHQVTCLVRRDPRADGEVRWYPERRVLDPYIFTGVDAVIHLAGASVAGGRWTPARKDLIMESRVGPTEFLAQTLADRPLPPPVLLCASATGYYGPNADRPVDERSPAGTGFLAEVCQEWEAAATSARKVGMRVVHLRFGVVLDASGGVLSRMILPFRLGLGGHLGSGQQMMSWISLRDALRAIQFCLECEAIEGPVNLVSPHALSNADFTQWLADRLKRPSVLPVPAWILRLLLGELAEELLLSSIDAQPRVLTEAGFSWEDAREPFLEL